MEILERAQELESRGRDIVHLEVGEPDFDTPSGAVEEGIGSIRNGRTHYTHSMGIAELRAAVARLFADDHGVDVDPDRVLVTVGSSAALLLSMAALCDPGDEIIVPDPGYACYPNIARTLGIVPRAVPVYEVDGFTYDPDRVSNAVGPRTKAIMLNSPANPTGAVTPSSVIDALVGIGPTVVSDEIYHGLVYESVARTALRSSEEAFVVSGFSKRYAMTGWRLGYLVVPPSQLRAVQALQQNLFISASEFGQHAALAAIESRAEVAAMRLRFDERRRYVVSELNRIGLRVPVPPQGAFYAFCDARRYTDDSMAFALDILETAGVAVAPGIDFGRGGEGWIRVSYATSMGRLKLGIERLEAYLAGPQTAGSAEVAAPDHS